MSDLWLYALWGCAAYLLGSVSFGDIVARIAGFPIREAGTGNPGVANTFREMGTHYSAIVLALDLAKGIVAMLPALLLDLPIWAGVVGAAGVLLGHFLPVFWGFRGGTGMVVAMGVSFGLTPLGALVAVPVALIALLLTKNAAFTGVAYFFSTALAGWWLLGDLAIPAMVLAAAGTVLVKSWTQYRWTERVV